VIIWKYTKGDLGGIHMSLSEILENLIEEERIIIEDNLEEICQEVINIIQKEKEKVSSV
jgi:hypothetical protein